MPSLAQYLVVLFQYTEKGNDSLWNILHNILLSYFNTGNDSFMTELQNNNDSNNPIYWRQRIYFYLTFKVDLKGEYMFNWLLSHFTIFIGFCFIFIPAQSHGYKRSKYFYQILLTPLMDVNVDIVIFPSWPSISRSIVLTDIARLMSMSLILNKKYGMVTFDKTVSIIASMLDEP